jgi:ABC-type nitrate/sulfonate/bicarbonate transport system ATPase subunit
LRLAALSQVLTAPGNQVDKVVQLYEVMLTRHTTMVVGQTGGGKSVILQALARAQVGRGLWTASAAVLAPARGGRDYRVY